MRHRLLPAGLLVAALLLAEPAHAIFLKLPPGTDPRAFRAARRKVVPQGTKVSNQPWRERNDKRTKDLTVIGNAIFNYRREHGGKLPTAIPMDKDAELCAGQAVSCTGLVDIRQALKPYLGSIPRDPTATGNSSRYAIHKDWKERAYLKALDAEEGALIRKMH